MRTFWIAAALALVVSLAGAYCTEALIDQRIAIAGGFLGLQKSYNPGIAFGVRLPGGLQELLIGAALIGVTVVALRSAHTRLSQIGFGLIIGGGAANVVDRIPDGLVTDMIQVGSFPIFNIADSCITIGVILLLVEGVFFGKKGKKVW